MSFSIKVKVLYHHDQANHFYELALTAWRLLATCQCRAVRPMCHYTL